ncbi:MAG: outer membrane beta-barrel protein [Bacteroidia bacterium]|nr:outer membrane beta-barrel protein [Bacteroidia bacterium]
MKKFILVLFIAFISTINADAQRWKMVRYEFNGGLGASNFLGELGGANQIGTNYFKDFEWSETRFGLAIGLRYKLSEFFAFNTHVTYGAVSGDDKLTDEFFRHYRNLNFNTYIFEWNLNFEAAFQQEQIGHRYRLRRVKGQKGYEVYAYAFVGAGIFNFDPKTEYQGTTVRLQPLGTEGQGLVPTRNKYSLWQFCIPIGFGFKYTIDAKWGVGIEYGMRKTFTDYIDDVSTTYFDNNELRAAYGNVAAALADRSDHSKPYITGPEQQRGDPRDLDAYMFAIFSVNYKIRTSRGGLPRF